MGEKIKSVHQFPTDGHHSRAHAAIRDKADRFAARTREARRTRRHRKDRKTRRGYLRPYSVAPAKETEWCAGGYVAQSACVFQPPSPSRSLSTRDMDVFGIRGTAFAAVRYVKRRR